MPTRLTESDGRFRLVLIIAAAITIAAFISLGLTLAQRFQESNQRRDIQRDVNHRVADALNRQATVLRDVLCLAQREVVRSRGITPEQRRRALGFYARALALNGTPKCPNTKGATP